MAVGNNKIYKARVVRLVYDGDCLVKVEGVYNPSPTQPGWMLLGKEFTRLLIAPPRVGDQVLVRRQKDSNSFDLVGPVPTEPPVSKEGPPYSLFAETLIWFAKNYKLVAQRGPGGFENYKVEYTLEPR